MIDLEPLPDTSPQDLIRLAMDGGRVFEARFLFRQFGETLAYADRIVLLKELTASLHKAEQILQDARAAVRAGKHQQALALYEDLEAVAIDTPGLSWEKKGVVSAIEGCLDQPRKKKKPKIRDKEPPAPVAEPEMQAHSKKSSPRLRRESRRVFWLLLLSGSFFVLFFVLLFLRSGQSQSPAQHTVASRQVAPSQKRRPTISINPLVNEEPMAEEVLPSGGGELKFRSLQIEERGE